MTKALKILLRIGLVMFFLVWFSFPARAESDLSANGLPAPTLIAPNEKTATADLQPLIIGLSRDNTLVKIYIDGIYNGQTEVLKDLSGTANFAFKPSVPLSRGWHIVQALSESGDQVSLGSDILNFEIQLPMPAPTVFEPVVNRATSSNRPFIVGLAKNDSKIKVYIDKKYQGELIVKNHQSGTANFAFKPAVPLSRGPHAVYAVALDKRGKASILSNLVDFSVKNSAISQSAAEERKVAAVKIQEPAEKKSEPVVISESSGAVVEKTAAETITPEKKTRPAEPSLNEKEAAIKQELKDKEREALEKITGLVGTGAEEVKSDQGMINEGKQNQGRLKLNLVLFILFLLGVVGWLLWVNRELVKERRAQTEAEEKKTEKKNNLPGQGPGDKPL